MCRIGATDNNIQRFKICKLISFYVYRYTEYSIRLIASVVLIINNLLSSQSLIEIYKKIILPHRQSVQHAYSFEEYARLVVVQFCNFIVLISILKCSNFLQPDVITGVYSYLWFEFFSTRNV